MFEIDDCDADLLLDYPWTIDKDGYPRTSIKIDGKYRTTFLHNIIAKRVGISSRVDHIDRDPGNNRRSNIRPCNNSQNIVNQEPNSSNTSGFKGVHFCARARKWRATFRKNGTKIHLGLFVNIEDAARTYDRAVKSHFGNFAYLNFPND